MKGSYMIEDPFNKYFIERTDKRLDDIENKIDQLISFRWMLLGMATAISSIVSIAIAVWHKG